MAAARGIDREEVRRLYTEHPDLSCAKIGERLGVTKSAISHLARTMGLSRTVAPQGCGTEACYRRGCRCRSCRFAHSAYLRERRQSYTTHREPEPTRWRCQHCGGQRSASVLHACHRAEPLTRGLTWVRQ